MVLESWGMLIASILLIYFIFLHDGPVLRMLAIIATTFTAMKVVAVTVGYENKNKSRGLKFSQWLAFAIGWAGMRAQPFETMGANALPNAWPMIKFGISRVIAGLLLILLAHIIVSQHLNCTVTHMLVSAILLVALSLTLHFGVLSISAGGWRLLGVNTYLLFKEPVKALSLAEFWSRRWNIAFSEMTSITVYRPLKNKIGSAMALMSAFIFSGFLHELALSVPVNSGYGLPLLYFVIQGCLVLVEKVIVDRKVRFLQRNIVARFWTLFWVIAPMPLLFHTQFIKEIVWPLAGLKY
jgi:D-alanyl-lipoteichoic acid acyltransferase DltB (MBOAT superfamily)